MKTAWQKMQNKQEVRRLSDSVAWTQKKLISSMHFETAEEKSTLEALIQVSEASSGMACAAAFNPVRVSTTLECNIDSNEQPDNVDTWGSCVMGVLQKESTCTWKLLL